MLSMSIVGKEYPKSLMGKEQMILKIPIRSLDSIGVPDATMRCQV